MGGGHHHQLLGPVGEEFAKRQRDHAAVGAADEGRDLVHAQVVQQQGQQPRLILGGDGQRRLGVLGVGTEIGGEIKGQDAETGQVDGGAHAHGARPPAQALGLGAVDVAVGRDAAGHDDQGGVGLAVQAADDLLLVQGAAEIEREAVGDRYDDVMCPVARQQLGRTACGRRPTGGLFHRVDRVDQGQGHGSRSLSKTARQGTHAVTDRGASPRRCSTHLSRSSGRPENPAGVGTVSGGTRWLPRRQRA
ncbi:hypothetical protein D3C86_1330450 [compost metagenome]